MRTPVRTGLILILAALAPLACKKGDSLAGGKGVKISNDVVMKCEGVSNEALATIDGKEVTVADVNATKMDNRLKDTLVKAESQLHETTRAALDEVLYEKLLDEEAKATSKSKEDLILAQVTNKTKKVGDPEVLAFYNDWKGKMTGAGRQAPPLDKVKEEIRKKLTNDSQGERKDAYYADLKKKYKVVYVDRKSTFTRPRFDVGTGSNPGKGPEKAPVTIVEFSDFQCPFCKKGAATLKEVEKAYKGKVRVFFRDFPLGFHDKAKPAAVAARCAGEQGKYWEYHDKLFSNQKLEKTDLLANAKDLGLNAAKFETCLGNEALSAAIDKDMEEGQGLGVNGTPAVFINGVMLSGAVPFENFKDVIDEELVAAKSASKSAMP